MELRKYIVSIFAVIFVLCLTCPQTIFPAQNNNPQITAVKCKNLETGSILTINLDMPGNFMPAANKNEPNKIILMPMDSMYSELINDFDFGQEGTGLVKKVAIVKNLDKPITVKGNSYDSVDFISIELKDPKGYKYSKQKKGFTIQFGNFPKQSDLPKVIITAKKSETQPAQNPQKNIEVKQKKEEPKEREQAASQKAVKKADPAKLASIEKEIIANKNNNANIKPQVQKEKQAPRENEAVAKPIAKKEQTIILSNIEKIDKDDNSAFTFLTNEYAPYLYYQLDNPLQLIIDPVVTVYSNLPPEALYTQGIVESVKFVKKDAAIPPGLDDSYYAIDYILITLTKPTKYTVLQSGGELNIAIGDIKKTLLAEEPPLPKPEPKKVTKKKEKQEEKKEPKEKTKKEPAEYFTLEECLNTALANHLPAKVAIEEIKLAQMKAKEAQRGLFPNLTIRATQTKGDVYEVAFTEKRYGVQIDQPIYHSGKLWNTYKQAKLNYQVARNKYEKVKAELAAKVTEAFYNLASSQENLVIQQELLAQAEELFAKSKKAYEKELVTQVEFLTVESQYNQVLYQLESAKRDFELARLSLQNLMNIDNEVPVKAKVELKFRHYDIKLSEALDVAYASRPELIINDLMVKVSMYEKKIAMSKTGFKIDLSGFYGKSGSAYEGETLTMDTDYSIGLQASKDLWGNTLNYSYNKDKTSPKLGQTTRTRSETNNLELAVLNNMSANSEIQAAHVGYLKAKADLVEITNTVLYEVKDAYYNFQKSAIQVGNIGNKVKIREQELKIAQMQSGLGETPISGLIESWLKLTDERTLYNTTLSGYYNAIAKLNKAVGIADYYKLD